MRAAAAAATAASCSTQNSPDDAPSSHDGPAKPARVLVVEDEESLGRALLRFLRGYEVVYCRSVKEAIDRVRAGEHFDVVISDMMMPGGTGKDLYEVLLALSPELAGRTVFMTGGATTPETMAFVAQHSEKVMAKPLDLANLRRRVDALLAQRGLLSRG